MKDTPKLVGCCCFCYSIHLVIQTRIHTVQDDYHGVTSIQTFIHICFIFLFQGGFLSFFMRGCMTCRPLFMFFFSLFLPFMVCKFRGSSYKRFLSKWVEENSKSIYIYIRVVSICLCIENEESELRLKLLSRHRHPI